MDHNSLRVRFGADDRDWPVQALDRESFAVRGSSLPAGAFVPVTFLISACLSVTVFVRADSVPASAGAQTFTFADTDADVTAILMSFAH
jgi:hypothetical protein